MANRNGEINYMNSIILPTHNLFYTYWLSDNNQWLSSHYKNTNYSNIIHHTEVVFNWGNPVFVIPSNGTYQVSGQIIKYTVTVNTAGPYEITLPTNTIIK